MADDTVKTVREWARAAKRAQEAAGEEQMSDTPIDESDDFAVCDSHPEECRCSKCIAREKVGRAIGGKVSDG